MQAILAARGIDPNTSPYGVVVLDLEILQPQESGLELPVP